MALLIPVGFVQCVFELALQDDPEPMATTLGLDVTGSVDDDGTESANWMFGLFNRHILPEMSSVYSLTGVTLYRGNADGTNTIFESTGAEVFGQRAVNPAPQNCAVLARKRTSLSGRRGRGRMYIPGIGRDYIEHDGDITAAERTVWQDAFDAFYAEMTAGSLGMGPFVPVVLHREEGAGVEPAPTPITLFEVGQKIATQRQRLRP